MSATTTETSKPHRRPRGPALRLPLNLNGEVWMPRKQWAEERGISDKTASRLNLETMLHGGVVYVCVSRADADLAARARRRNEPPQRRRLQRRS
jgi:hypothetical protein